MIRWMFVLLVLANAFYALWQWQSSPAELGQAGQGSKAPVPSLVLLDELAPGESALLARSEVVETPELERVGVSPEPSGLELQCWALGSFDKKTLADQAVSVAQSMQLKVRLNTIQVPEASDYWVHLGPFASRERALGVLQQMRGRGIDSFLIGDGELENAISLGFFSQRVSAERMIARHRDLGYPVRVHEVPRFRDRYELFVEGRVTRDDLLARYKVDDIAVTPAKRAKKSCI